MISRRKFLEAGSITACVAMASSVRAAASATECSEQKTSPSIAGLKSRKSEATPITREERAQRWERARQLMSENALDGILLMEGTSLKYFTGIRWWGGERTFALVLPQKGSPFTYVPPSKKDAPASRSPTLRKEKTRMCASGRKIRARII